MKTIQLQSFSIRQRLLLAAACGLLVASGLPPLYLLPLVYLGFFLQILLLLNHATHHHRGWEAFIFGFTYALGGTYWIIEAMLINPEMHAWLAPIALPALAATMALFIALPFVVAARIQGHFAQYCALVVALAVAEWLRGFLFDFPWNNFSQTFGLSNAMLQPLAMLGRDGYSLLVIASLCLPAFAINRAGVSRLRKILVTGLGLAIPVLFVIFGTIRLDQAPDSRQQYWANAGLRLVQPNIAQADKIDSEKMGQNLTRLIDLSFEKLPGWVSHIIWPEVALNLDIMQYPNLTRDLGSLLPAGGILLTGSLRQNQAGWFNSLLAIDSLGASQLVHDKVTLVPFGEYMPVPFLHAIAGIAGGGFRAGQKLSSFSTGQLPSFTSLICYEVIFSGSVVAEDGKSQWLLNVTNDAWFGQSSGPYQHFAITRWRAIEEGLPLVRVANTGISAVFDAYGRILAELPLGEAGGINIRLPKPLSQPTIYRQHRSIPADILLGLFILMGIIFWLRETKPRVRFEL